MVKKIKIKCIYCKKKRASLCQVRMNKSIKKPIYSCEICKRRFTPKDSLPKFRHSLMIISLAINLHKEGFSLSEVKDYLKINFNVTVSRKTILDWKKKFQNQD